MISLYRTTSVVGIALIVLAAAPCAQERVAIHDDFADYSAGSNASPLWQVVDGKWRVEDGTYVQSLFRKDEMYSFLREPVVSDFTLSARFRVYPEGSGVRAAGLVFRSQSSLLSYFAHYDSKHSQMLLYRQTGEVYEELARIGRLPIAPDQWHTGKIVCTGPSISVYLDDKLLCERQDSTYLAGRVGLRTGQGKVAFDDVTVEGTPAKLDKEWVIMAGSIKPSEDDVPRLTVAEHVVAERGGGYFPVLIRLQDGRLAAVVRGGDTHLGIKGRLDWIESGDGGKTWSTPRVIVDSEWDDRNPSFGQMANGTIVLGYAECQAYNAEKKWDTKAGGFAFYYVTSKDGGKTWAAKRPLARGPIGSDASPYGRIIVLKDGTAVMSVYGDVNRAYTGPDRLPEGAGPWVCGLVRSRDHGETWADFSLISGKGHNETSLLELADGTLLAALRTTADMVDQAVSTDGGRTWSDPVPVTGGPARRSRQHPADMVRLQSGNLLMVYGNRLDPFGAEAILSIDADRTWAYDHRVLLGWTSLHGDCGYPSAVQLDDGTIVCLYYSVGTEDLPEDEQAIAVRFTEEQLRKAVGL